MTDAKKAPRRGGCTYIGTLHWGGSERDMYCEVLCGQTARKHDDSRGHEWQRDMTAAEVRAWKRNHEGWYAV